MPRRSRAEARADAHALPRKYTKAFTERAREPQNVGIYTGLFCPIRLHTRICASYGEVSDARCFKKRDELVARRAAGTRPSRSLEHYTGTYKNDYYGKATVILEGEQLALRYGSLLSARLEHWHYDTFKTFWRLPFFGEDLVTFILNSWGQVEEMKVSDFADFTRVGLNENA
jgi:hypothetical protein